MKYGLRTWHVNNYKKINLNIVCDGKENWWFFSVIQFSIVLIRSSVQGKLE